MDEGITLKTFRDLIRHGYKLSGYCRRYSVHKDIDMTVPRPDRDYVGARFKCRDCGGKVEITLSLLKTSNSDVLPGVDRWRER